MKKTIFKTKKSSKAIVMTMLAAVSLAACSSDDEPTTPTSQSFSGSFTTTIPSMPSFDAIQGENTAEIIWSNPEQTKATVRVESFDISMSTPVGDRSYEIGEMVITDVDCVKTGEVIELTKPEFECQAGEFLTTGSLSGKIDNGTLTLTLLYKPGSMPFDVQSVLEGKE